MKRIAVLSDTHGYLDDRILHFLSDRDEVWHAGDIGPLDQMNALIAMKNIRCVHGNIDGNDVRKLYTQFDSFKVEELRILMTHIAGPFGNYNSAVRDQIDRFKPHLLVCGHSHILKVSRDDRFHLMYMNPGAAGRHGLHKVRTLLLFEVIGAEMKNLQVVELGPRSANPIR